MLLVERRRRSRHFRIPAKQVPIPVAQRSLLNTNEQISLSFDEKIVLTEDTLSGIGVVVSNSEIPLRDHLNQGDQIEDRTERNEQRRSIEIFSHDGILLIIPNVFLNDDHILKTLTEQHRKTLLSDECRDPRVLLEHGNEQIDHENINQQHMKGQKNMRSDAVTRFRCI